MNTKKLYSVAVYLRLSRDDITLKNADRKEETYKINSLHKKIDSNTFAAIPLNMESAGTLKMFALYPELQDVLEKGSVFFIDELNAR